LLEEGLERAGFMAAILYHPCYSVESMPSGEKTSVCVILAYNCANVLENTYRRIPKDAVDRIILVDDASTDNTLEVARRLGIESYTHEHLGYGGNVKYSIRKGIELGAEYIVDLHGDGQYDPGAIPKALEKAREGYDLGRAFELDQHDFRIPRHFQEVGQRFAPSSLNNIPDGIFFLVG